MFTMRKSRRRLVAVPTLSLASALAFAPVAFAQPPDDQSNRDGTEQSSYNEPDRRSNDRDNDAYVEGDQSNRHPARNNSENDNTGTGQSSYNEPDRRSNDRDNDAYVEGDQSDPHYGSNGAGSG